MQKYQHQKCLLFTFVCSTFLFCVFFFLLTGKVDELGKANQRFREKDLELSQVKTKLAMCVEEHAKELKSCQQKNFEQYQDSLRQTKVAHHKEIEEFKKEVSQLRERLDVERARFTQERQQLQSSIEDYQLQAKVFQIFYLVYFLQNVCKIMYV